MNNGWRPDDQRREEAAAWVVRLEATHGDEAEALAFDAWLQQSAANGAAFDEALAVSQTFRRQAAEIRTADSTRRIRPQMGRRALFGAAAAAAVAAVALVVPRVGAPITETFATARGQTRALQLADGSRLDLNAGTRLSVTLRRTGRDVVLHEGQAVFDVAPDASRPFVIAAGDRTVRVVGTQFDVRRRDGKLSVTVAHGAVEVRPATGAAGASYRLHPGQRLDHLEGADGVRVTRAEPAEVLGWRAGRLVFREQPLSDVVADLNQQYARPIRVPDPALAATPVSGVLILDDQDAVIRRLALLLPIRAVRSDTGVVLEAR